jgi:hypothetical protein
MNGHAKSLMENLIKIALTGHSEKNRLDATIYGLNRIYGTPTNKIENTVTDKDNKDNKDSSSDNINNMIEELETNVVELKQAK